MIILIGLGVYSLYGYLRLESPPIQEEAVLKTPPPAHVAPTPGVTPNEIVIGSSLALGGHASFLGTQYLHGAMCLINQINKEGGIHHRKITVIAYDDGYDPPRCVANTERLIHKDKVFCLFCYVGTPTSVKIIDIVEEAKIPLLGLFTGADKLRFPFRHYIFNVRSSYYQETNAVVRYFVEEKGLRRIAVFYQYDDYGFDGLKGTQIALQKYGLSPVATGSFIRGTLEIEDALDKIQASRAQAVIMIGTYSPCAKFIKEARARGFNPLFHNVSFVGADKLVQELGDAGEGVLITQVVPPPTERILLPATEQYSRLLTQYYPQDEPNFVSFEGFINARILIEALRRAGRDITREGFIRALESIREHYVGIGAVINFGPRDHQGIDDVYLTEVRNGKLQLLLYK
ncbi:MAG: ABC transporter substrate-binding protein [Deltaproteobacteria bacterium]|nr:ABC transporter substrate-binding protein [Deltaproteobacteria bacterium]MBW2020004.1 ABC transporter substrate-binding protein [Deltaproteobacteria bacterium]MBW2074820.1 ABC transporter substrate-binding protein [Deltaproteobacteria bacterium]